MSFSDNDVHWADEVESKRQSTYGSKLTDFETHLQAKLQSLEDSVDEVGRAERFMLGCALVHQARADAMEAMGLDVLLDNEFDSVVDESKKKQLQQERCQQGFEALSDETNTKDTKAAGMLHSVVESQSVVANHFTEDALLVTNHLGKEIMTFHQDYQSHVAEFEQRGNKILDKLRLAETTVAEAWEAYTAATKNPRVRRSSWVGSKQKDASQLETEYAVALVQQRRTWQQFQNQISRVFQDGARLEQEGRDKLLELLNDYIPGQRRLYSTSASTHTQVLKELEEQNVNQFYSQHDEKILPSESDDHDMTSVPMPDMASLSLGCSIAVVEKQTKNGWLKVLAIVTQSEYLHLFEMPSSSDKAIINPHQVFLELFPGNKKQLTRSKSSRRRQLLVQAIEKEEESTHQELKPLESFHLPACIVRGKEKGKDVMEVDIQTDDESSSRLFKNRKRNVVVRAFVNNENTKQFISKIYDKPELEPNGRTTNNDPPASGEKGVVAFV